MLKMINFLTILLVYVRLIEEETDKREGKGLRCCLGDVRT